MTARWARPFAAMALLFAAGACQTTQTEPTTYTIPRDASRFTVSLPEFREAGAQARLSTSLYYTWHFLALYSDTARMELAQTELYPGRIFTRADLRKPQAEVSQWNWLKTKTLTFGQDGTLPSDSGFFYFQDFEADSYDCVAFRKAYDASTVDEKGRFQRLFYAYYCTVDQVNDPARIARGIVFNKTSIEDMKAATGNTAQTDVKSETSSKMVTCRSRTSGGTIKTFLPCPNGFNLVSDN